MTLLDYALAAAFLSTLIALLWTRRKQLEREIDIYELGRQDEL